MMRTLIGGLSGILFGAGLELSGMTDPRKVQGFLDITGSWDPSLACVMAGALCVSAISVVLAKRSLQTWVGDVFAWPTARDLDPRLLIGSALFGIGWGMAGLCPGPAVANLQRADFHVVLFFAAMLAGMGLFSLWQKARPPGQASPAEEPA